MCGISCYIASETHDSLTLNLERSLDYITHRGHSRYLYECMTVDELAIGCHRLPFTSGYEQQPVSSPSGRYLMVMNGEIFNLHPKRKLVTNSSDTSRLAELLDQQGLRAFNDLDGMFAIMVYDSHQKVLHLARDQFGIKPLYYATNGHSFLASSEIKGICHFDQFHEINHLPPGSVGTLNVATKNFTIESISTPLPTFSYIDDYPLVLLNALRESVLACTNDRELYGLYLSGGLDSSLIYVLMIEGGRNVVPIVLGTDISEDRRFATELCNIYGQIPHYVTCPDEGSLFRTIHTTIQVVEGFEPNLVRQSAFSMLLAQGAQQLGLDVVLCGEGADELFGGYPELTIPSKFIGLRKAFLQDLHRTQLQRVDRTAMAHTIEVRVPYLSKKIAELALIDQFLDIQTGAGNGEVIESKYALRRAAISVLPRKFVWRKKNVLSEGAGLKGNDPNVGLFSDLFKSNEFRSFPSPTNDEIQYWNLHTTEEMFYFQVFKTFGYNKYRYAKNRVSVNMIHTL